MKSEKSNFTYRKVSHAPKGARKPTQKLSTAVIVAYTGILLSLVGVVLAGIIYFTYLYNLPPISSLQNDILPESTVIYDRK